MGGSEWVRRCGGGRYKRRVSGCGRVIVYCMVVPFEIKSLLIAVPLTGSEKPQRKKCQLLQPGSGQPASRVLQYSCSTVDFNGISAILAVFNDSLSSIYVT